MTAKKTPIAQKTGKTGAPKSAKAKKAAPAPTPRKTGRPTAFTDKLADQICEALANKKSMRQICAAANMPHRTTVQEWIAKDPAFATKCARAREEQADAIVEDCIDIENKTLTGKIHPAAARAVLASKQWRASKLAPKKYGDKLGIGGAEDLPPIQTTQMPDAETAVHLAKILNSAGVDLAALVKK